MRATADVELDTRPPLAAKGSTDATLAGEELHDDAVFTRRPPKSGTKGSSELRNHVSAAKLAARARLASNFPSSLARGLFS